MFRLLLVLILIAAGLALTNPTTDDVRSQINAQFASQVSGTVGTAPIGQTGLPDAVTSLLTEKVQEELQIERKNYFVLSIFKVSVGGSNGGGTPLPGCLIGIAKQAIPYDKC